MRLKCIGGPMDGIFWAVHKGTRLHDVIRIPEYPKSVCFDFKIGDEIPTSIRISYYTYIYDMIRYRTEHQALNQYTEWQFLRYERTRIQDIFNSIFK